MKKRWKVLLILVAVVCFAISLSYPLKYKMEEKSTEATMEKLVELRDAGLAKRGGRGDGRQRTNTAEEAGKESAEESGLQATSEQPEGSAPSDSESEAEGAQAQSEAAAPGEPEGELGEAAEQPSEPNQSEEAQSQAESQLTEEESLPAQAQAQLSQDAEANVAASAPEGEQSAAQTQEQPGAAETQEQQSAAQTQEQPGAAETEAEGGEATEQPREIRWKSSGGAQVLPGPTPVTTPMAKPTPTPEPTATPTPGPTVNRFERSGAQSYDQLPKRTLNVDKILPQFQEIYAENQDFAGWITIPNTTVDYPVVQNGQIILDTKCDPYTPSYNLVVSGHSMRSGKMFGRLVNYMNESYWENHKLVYFDTLMEERTYEVFAAFFSADYDVDETGFRYNADIQYSVDAKNWLREIEENKLYDTGVDVKFGDEFLTLTTCNKAHRSDGRFVVVCRRLREGEEVE